MDGGGLAEGRGKGARSSRPRSTPTDSVAVFLLLGGGHPAEQFLWVFPFLALSRPEGTIRHYTLPASPGERS